MKVDVDGRQILIEERKGRREERGEGRKEDVEGREEGRKEDAEGRKTGGRCE